MELPDRIEDMTKEQLQHLDMLVDQLDAAYPTDRMDEERLAKDPNLAILPSGMKISTADILEFRPECTMAFATTGVANSVVVNYRNGKVVFITDPHDVAAFNAALNDIGVYVAAPTLKGDDADGDGKTREAGHDDLNWAPV